LTLLGLLMWSRFYWPTVRVVAALAALALVAVPATSTAFSPIPEYFCCKHLNDPTYAQRCSEMSLTAEKCQAIIERTEKAQEEWVAEHQRGLKPGGPQPCEEK
jgi:hypothetical protein